MQNGGSWQSGKLDSPTGASLQLYELIPAKPKAIIHINHGMAEHAGRYARFARALNDAGYGAIAHDHRGHGQTTAPDAARGIFAKVDGWAKVIADVEAANNYIRTENSNVPIVVFGHSMGSIIALNYTLKHHRTIAGSTLWNSGVDAGALMTVFRLFLKIQRMFKGSDVPSPLIRKLTFDTWNKVFKPNRTDFDWLSLDEVEVNKYVADPNCGFDVSIGLWLDLVEGILFGADDRNLAALPKNFPVHLQGGAADPCTENGKAMASIEARMNAAGLQDVTLELLVDTRHESLNEVNREETTQKFIAWLDTRFG